MLLIRCSKNVECAVLVAAERLSNIAHRIGVKVVIFNVKLFQRNVHLQCLCKLMSLLLLQIGVRQKQCLDVRVGLHGGHQLWCDPLLDIRRRHDPVAEIEFGERLIVQIRSMNHPNHPIAQSYRLVGFLHLYEFRNIKDLLNLLCKSLVHFSFIWRLRDVEGQFAACGPSCIRGHDLVCGYFCDLLCRATNNTGRWIQLQPFRQRRFDRELTTTSTLDLRFQHDVVAYHEWVARRWVR
mmetsp:Transcript_137741/g.238732  ORF Transcript_137741/g.238732 Transcript_137741/m.238732 type:complete len:238 (-) Transcript_137741:2154-2867(-)